MKTAKTTKSVKSATPCRKFVGAHVSAAGGLMMAPEKAHAIGAKAFALFTKNQRQWQAKPLLESEVDAFKTACRRFEFDSKYILPHDSYLINLGSPVSDDFKKSLKAFVEEIKRCETLGLKLLNFHPGAHKKMATEAECIATIASALNTAIEETSHLILVLENTAGQGSSVGYRFEHIRDIIAQVKYQDRIGVCLDTCHAFAAGYDLKSAAGYAKVMDEFEKVIGFSFLRGMHLNDSKVPFGSRKDRHHNLGFGDIGWDLFKRIMQDSRFDDIPLILETIDEELWAAEIKKLYSFAT